MFFSIGKDEQSVKGFLIAFAVGKYSHAMLSVGRTAEIKILNDQVFGCPSAARIDYFSIADLFGQPISYVMAELERRISEALLQDSRITSVENFEFDYKKNKVFCKFTVVTIFGETEIEKVVNV